MRRCLCLVPSILLILICFSSVTFAQQRLTKSRESEPDNPAARELWFREGRILPDGSPAAKHLTAAFQQKAKLRQARANAARAKSAAGVALPAAANGASVWTSVGPSPIADDGTSGPVTGRIAAVAVDQNDTTGNTVYVGGAFGGLWKSVNAATPVAANVLWTPLIDQQASLAVGAIALKPGDSNVILVGTGEDKSAVDSYYGVGILRSADGGTTWTQITGDADGHSFLGVGFGRMAWSTQNTANVVAATGSTALGNRTGLFNPQFTPPSASGLYYSHDAGVTWHLATVLDGATSVTAAAHSVVYNAQQNKFYAAVRFHGMYQSADGATWTRVAVQPDAANVNLTNCPTTAVATCPFYRGELAVRADADDMFIWYASTSSSDTTGDGGVWRTRDGGATWTALDKTGIDNCDSPNDTGSDACGVYQAFFYNMYVGAAPNPSNPAATDVYIGAGNIMKCTLDASHTTCANTNANPNRFMNLTRVYGCSGNWAQLSHVHPDQHHIGFPTAKANVVYFANDGGIYRTLNAGGLNDDLCTDNLPFDNLNTGPLTMTQFVWGTTHPTDASALLAGAQDVGTALISSTQSGTNQKTWQPLPVGGDGGYNAFGAGNFVLQSFTDTNINICNAGLACPSAQSAAQWNLNFVTSATVGNDSAGFYMPWLLDPRDQTKLILGTCRVWRGAVTFSTPFAGTALSQKLSNNSGLTACTDTGTAATSDSNIYALAAGGPAAASGGSSVIYAGLGNGTIGMTTAADTVGNWVNRTPPASLNPGPNWTGSAFRISSLWVDPAVSTGLTVYATIQGFRCPHVLKSIDGGGSWANVTGDLPDAPVNNIVTDPDDHTIIYLGTDTGVYVSTNNGTNWVEVGPTEPGGATSGFLPNVPVMRVTFFKSSTAKTLYAFTYGRGAWKTDLAAVAGQDFTAPLPDKTNATVTAGTSATFNVSVSPTGTAFSSIITFSCTGLPSRASCSFAPATVTPGVVAASTVLTISTAKTTTTAVAVRRVHSAPLFALWMGLPGMLLLPAMRRRKLLMSFAGFALVILLIVSMSGCGGGGGSTSSNPITNPGTPAGTYTVQVVATSGSLSHSTQITLTVQ